MEAAHPNRPPRLPTVRYLGFKNTEEGRAYQLRVDSPEGLRSITVTIPHQAFTTGQARFQDAPELCFAKLQRALAEHDELPDGLELLVGSAELEEFRESRRPPERKKRPRPTPPEQG